MSLIETPSVGPMQKPRGQAKQDVETSPDLLRAVQRRFGRIECDLAATAANRVTERFYSPEQDSLKQSWANDFPQGCLWLNPQFGDIGPWAEKCALEARLRAGVILLLVPASVGSNWWASHVMQQAMVHALTPRVKFVGHADVFPKDLALCVYGNGATGFGVWDWGLYNRFFDNVKREGTCWLWQGGSTDRGYGVISVRNRTRRAHRVAYEMFKGPVPDDALVTHSCDTPGCVNPRHLSLGTPLSNMREKVERGRAPSIKGNTKLSAEQIPMIRSSLASGATLREIAIEHDVSPATVANVRDGVTWGDA